MIKLFGLIESLFSEALSRVRAIRVHQNNYGRLIFS